MAAPADAVDPADPILGHFEGKLFLALMNMLFAVLEQSLGNYHFKNCNLYTLSPEIFNLKKLDSNVVIF